MSEPKMLTEACMCFTNLHLHCRAMIVDADQKYREYIDAQARQIAELKKHEHCYIVRCDLFTQAMDEATKRAEKEPERCKRQKKSWIGNDKDDRPNFETVECSTVLIAGRCPVCQAERCPR